MDNNRNIPTRNNQGGPNNQKKNKIISVVVTLIAVSYTHLDVYKRQYNDFYNNSCSHCCLHIQNDFLVSKQRTYGV